MGRLLGYARKFPDGGIVSELLSWKPETYSAAVPTFDTHTLLYLLDQECGIITLMGLKIRIFAYFRHVMFACCSLGLCCVFKICLLFKTNVRSVCLWHIGPSCKPILVCVSMSVFYVYCFMDHTV